MADVRLTDEGLRVCDAAGGDGPEETRQGGFREESAALHGRVRGAVGVGDEARGVPPL